ncbi:hypothetical protein PanWU01x14_023600 [Parasponia andersonii]|uniref:Uncharacterized protein n=1 Tax=Parasponia andersonii TaxID=3476 RepID=A0A2P5DXL3_PARAD|nr:hypothetical protein PanWU01x14_023600 [Parasponia andersonii]
MYKNKKLTTFCDQHHLAFSGPNTEWGWFGVEPWFTKVEYWGSLVVKLGRLRSRVEVLSCLLCGNSYQVL